MPGRIVGTRYIPAVITVPAGTPKSAPSSTAIALGDVSLDEVQLVVPPGHYGLTGIQFQYAQVPILPWNNLDGWFVGNDFRQSFTVDFEVSTPLIAVAYNLDVYDHSFYVYVRISDLAAPVVTAVPIIPVS